MENLDLVYPIRFEKLVEMDFDLAECPRWDWRFEQWMWVNICDGELWRYKNGISERMKFNEPLGCFAMHGSKGYLLALKSGIFYLEAWGGGIKLISELISEAPRMRYNDGRVAPGGRFVAGTRNGAKVGPKGQFYQLHHNGKLEPLPMYAWTCNGLAFSPDGKWLYWADTSESKIYKHKYDVKSGEYGKGEIHCDLTEYEGRPDGASVDQDGNYWVAMYGGSSIIKVSASGQVLALIPVEVENPTMVGFGGDCCSDILLTSANADSGKGNVLIAHGVLRGQKEYISNLDLGF